MGTDMNEPVISVVIPAYNCADTLGRAVDSALCQDVPVEVLVIDDCSQEDLIAVLEKYRDRPEVRYYRNVQNLGASGSRNRGVSLAKGQYIAFLDGDDYWRPEKLRRQLAAMERTGAVLCATARELMDPRGELSGRVIPVRPTITYRDLLKHNSISCSSVLLRREVALEFPMAHEDAHEDYIMWLEILRKYDFACGVNEPLLVYRLSATGKSGSKLQSAAMTFRTYRYMGFGLLKSCACFCSYAVHGIAKYWPHPRGGSLS